MIGLRLDYASPSALVSQKDRATLGLSAESKAGIRFKGKLKSEYNFLLRTALRAMGDILWADDRWWSDLPTTMLDPIVTVHSDKLFFETFSFDQTAHALLAVDNDIFEIEGAPKCGSANIDFTAWLWGALGEMRSSRDTWLHIDTAGLELASVAAGGRFERAIELQPEWLRGYLELQAASTLPGTRLKLRPVDLLGVVRFLRYSKPKTSPRALRYEFEPDQPARIVLEPWEEVFVLHGTEHSYDTPKSTRLWGRNRLRLLEPLLPFTDSVEVYLKGRGMPSFYLLRLPGMEFLLSLTGRNQQRFTNSGGLSLLSEIQKVDEEKYESATEKLKNAEHMSEKELAESLGVTNLGPALCARGQAFFNPSNRRYRYRAIFPKKLDMAEIFPVDERVTKALEMADSVEIKLCQTRETRKVKKLPTPGGKVLREIIFTDWHIEGSVDDQAQVEVVLNHQERIIFGKCGCKLFQENLLTSGPCEHMLALREASTEARKDLPTSSPIVEGGN